MRRSMNPNHHHSHHHNSNFESFERSSTPNQRIMSPRYERNENGVVEYRYEIDVSDYRPDEVRVTQSGHSVTVDASCMKTTENNESNSSCSRSERKEYHKTISLPNNVDITKEMSQVIENGRLVIKIPVLPPGFDYNTLQSTGSLSSKDSGSQSGSLPRSIPLQHHSDRHQYHTEILHLDPCFTKNDIKINVNGHTVHVSARARQNDEHGCKSERQYNSEHKFPAAVDLDKIQAEWIGGIGGELRISAPYK